MTQTPQPMDEYVDEGPDRSAEARLRRLTQRVATGLPLALAAAALIWAGPFPFALLVLLFALFGVSEVYDLTEFKGFRPARRTGAAATILIVLGAYFLDDGCLAHVVLLCVVASLVLFVFRSPQRVSALVDGSTTIMGFLYCGWLPAHFILLRKLESLPAGTEASLVTGAGLVTWLVTLCAATDVGAYFVGKALGRTKLCPQVSPGKTVEGALGGLILATLIGWYLGRWFGIAPAHCLTLAILGSLTAQVGDLWESALKRDVGVKDSGNLIEGHGGVLDRFDSYFLAAPVFYLYVTWFM
ncbi:MAG: phosphatidate cytidylyltransferase [Burkholderiales bacterium]|nr:phosphatidate cytidylyltransferase [Burkholderiales bacterium]